MDPQKLEPRVDDASTRKFGQFQGEKRYKA